MNKRQLSLLLVGCMLAPITLKAQGGEADQPTELAYRNDAAPAAPASSTPATENPTPRSHWVIGQGVLDAFYHSSATIATYGQQIPGSTAKVGNSVTFMFAIQGDIAKNFSVAVLGGIPPKANHHR
jgi:hypothetical protein